MISLDHTKLLLVAAFLLVCITHKAKNINVYPKNGESIRRRATEIIMDIKPIMHTYIDKSESYTSDDLLHLWMDAWTKAGWDIKILDWGDAIKHPKYLEYKKLLDDAGICCLPRQTYLRNLAMGSIPQGGFYSDVYVFPLHKLSSIPDGKKILTGDLPNNGVMTIYDGVIGSAFSGEQKEWDRLTSALFHNLEKNMALSLLKIKTDSPDSFYFRNDEMYDNFVKSSNDVCAKAENKFIMRFHMSEMQPYGFEEQSRTFIINQWFENYKKTCWRK